ncbi:MAG: hypothetical protein ACXWIP_21850 [Burkholderiales bacterium]
MPRLSGRAALVLTDVGGMDASAMFLQPDAKLYNNCSRPVGSGELPIELDSEHARLRAS